MSDPSHQLNYEELHFEPDHTFREQPIQIFGSEDEGIEKERDSVGTCAVVAPKCGRSHLGGSRSDEGKLPGSI